MVSFEFHFELGKAVKSPPQYEVCFQKYGVFTVLSHHFQMRILRLEYHFEKQLEDFVPNTSEIIILFHFSYRCHIFGESNPSPSPNFRISYFLVLTHVC
jgi:hypothetical protein